MGTNGKSVLPGGLDVFGLQVDAIELLAPDLAQTGIVLWNGIIAGNELAWVKL